MKFTIDRSKWKCGGSLENVKGKGNTHLLNSAGYMCCLGFVCNQIGFTNEQILNIGMPEEIPEEVFKKVKEDNDVTPIFSITKHRGHMVYFNNDLSEKAISINDDPVIGVIEREVKLTELFAKHGHELEFKGEYDD